jgi:hypothetical protein
MSTSSLFELALSRLRAGRTLGGALTSTVLLTLPTVTACLDQSPQLATVESGEWAQYEGTRDTRMVSYTGQYSTDCAAPNTRFGCGATAIHVKLRVQAVENADLAWKRVGIVYHLVGDSNDYTAVGSYVASYGDGTEEWQVTAVVPQWQTVMMFDAWYQDGRGHTFIDDNQGELHVVNAGPAYQVVRVEPWMNTVTVGDNGVSGRVSVQLADLDYDKQLELVATRDGWQTVLHFGLGAAGDKNVLYWAEDLGTARERWQIDLDLPGSTDHFEYAVRYRHGVVNNATSYDFWDNNFEHNYVVDRPVVIQ